MDVNTADEEPAGDEKAAKAPRKRRRRRKKFWKRVRKPLARSRFVKNAVAGLLKGLMRFVHLTNPPAEGVPAFAGSVHEREEPAIVALWHGQHIMLPPFYPSRTPMVTMVSRSADAEINALVLEKFGFETVRGSGGRADTDAIDKGGARALIALKKSLDAGKNVCMIADIPNGTPREAGMGIVLLARLSGRPIYPVALATSRRRVVERSWDRTTINLPFGRSALIAGEPLYVPADADDAGMELKRRELTDALNAATAEAQRLVDGPR